MGQESDDIRKAKGQGDCAIFNPSSYSVVSRGDRVGSLVGGKERGDIRKAKGQATVQSSIPSRASRGHKG